MNGLNLKLILSLVDKVTAPVKKLRDGFVGHFKAMSDSILQFGDRMEKVGKKLEEVGGWLTTRLTLPITGFGLLSMRTAGQNEQLALSLESVAGSAEAAHAYLKQLQEMSRNTPFALEDVVHAAANLRTAGYEVERTNEMLGMLGEIAAKSKKSLSEMVGMYLDMRLAGKVGASDLHNLMKANVPIVEELSRQLGVSHQRVYQLAEDGKISFIQMRDAMRAMTAEGGVLHGTMDKYGKSIFGMGKELLRSLNVMMGEFGERLYKQLEVAEKIKQLTQFVRGLFEAFMKLPAPMQDFIIWTGLIAAALGPIVLVVGQITIGIGLFAMGMGKLLPIIALAVKAFTGFFAILYASPLGWIATACLAAGAAGILLVRNWSKVSAFFASLWTSVKESFATGIDFIMSKVGVLLDVVEKIKSGFASLRDLAADNPVTRQWNRLFGPDEPEVNPALANAPKAPIHGALSRVDAGGTVNIKIDTEGRVTAAAGQPNDRRMDYSIDTGLLGASY